MKITKCNDKPIYVKVLNGGDATVRERRPDEFDLVDGWKQFKDVYKVSYNYADISNNKCKTYEDLIKVIKAELNTTEYAVTFRNSSRWCYAPYIKHRLEIPNIRDKVVYVGVGLTDYDLTEDEQEKLARLLRIKYVRKMYCNFIEPNIAPTMCEEMEFVRTDYDTSTIPDIIYKQHVDVTNENSFIAKAIIKSVKDKLETILKPLGLTYSVYFNLSNLFVKIDYNALDKTFNKEENI